MMHHIVVLFFSSFHFRSPNHERKEENEIGEEKQPNPMIHRTLRKKSDWLIDFNVVFGFLANVGELGNLNFHRDLTHLFQFEYADVFGCFCYNVTP